MIRAWIAAALLAAGAEARPTTDILAEAEALAARADKEGKPTLAREAIARFEEVLKQAPEDARTEARVWDGLGTAHWVLGDSKGTRDALQRALERQRLVGDERALARALCRLGLVLASTGDAAAAGEHAAQALELSRARGDPGGQAEALHILGGVSERGGDRGKALEQYEEAKRLREQEGNPLAVAAVRHAMGSVYTSMGEAERALREYEEVLELYRAHGGPAQAQYIVLHNIGRFRFLRGEPELGMKLLHDALAMAEAAENRRIVPYFLRTLSRCHGVLGRHRDALAAIERAVPMFREAGDGSGEARGLNTLAERLAAVGQWHETLAPLERALALVRAQGDRPFEVEVLHSLGLSCQALGRPAEARARLEQAVELASATSRTHLEGQARTELARLQIDAGEHRAARASLERAVSLHAADRDYGALGRAQDVLGRLEMAEGNPEQAREHWLAALANHRRIGVRQAESDTLGHLADAEASQGRLTEARERAREALEIVESLRGTVPDAELRISYLAGSQEVYGRYVDLLVQSHAKAPEAGYAALAFEVADRARSRGLLDALAHARVDVRHGVDPARLAEDARLRETLNAREYQRVELLRKGSAGESLAAVEKEIEALVAARRELQRRLAVESPRYATLQHAPAVSLSDVQREVLDEDTALLEYVLGKDRSHLWVLTRARLDVFVLPPRSVIEPAVHKLRRQVTARAERLPFETEVRRRKRIAEADAALPAAAEEVSRLLLEPASSRLIARRLLIVPHGVLQYVPFSALPRPGTAGEPLVVTHEIVLGPSASVLAALQREPPHAGRTAGVLVVADPVFESDDPRVTRTAARRTSGTMPARGDVHRAAQAFGMQKIPRLAHSRREAESILALVAEPQRHRALGFEARRSALSAERLRSCRILHFATHGFVDDDHPELSGLVLSLVDERGNPQDGFLRLHDIYNMEVGADLVVLNACRTATGAEKPGEGLIGLTRGFLHAGARRVLASLWDTSDEAAASLMTDFYRAYLRQGRTPAAALREAQLAMRARREPPYYWAALVLQGQ